jgi:RNA polymerase sigma-70 factor (ECF subfamily)
MTVPGADQRAASFEAHRRYLVGLAYRMLGSLAEAEDAVQEAYLRWHRADIAAIDDPRAFLAKVVTRLCLDHLKSARVRRESYVGPWLPEPVLDTAALDAESASEYAHDLSMALMLTLERLSPLERAAFLLHDVFDMPFAEIAEALGRDAAACRQLAARARTHVRAARPRFAPAPEEGARLADAFRRAVRSGDVAAMTQLLAGDAVLYTDGGGKRIAALNPIHGADKIARFFAGIVGKARDLEAWRVRAAPINGLPGFIYAEPDGALQIAAFDIRDDRIAAVYLVLNPEKLARVAF